MAACPMSKRQIFFRSSVGRRRAGHNTQFADYRAAGRLSAPRGETLPLFPPQPMENFIANARVRAAKKGAAPPSMVSLYLRLMLGFCPDLGGRRRSKVRALSADS